MKNSCLAFFLCALTIAVVSSTVLELNTDREGYLVLSCRRVGRETVAPYLARFTITLDDIDGRSGEPVRGRLNITTVDNRTIITRSFLRSDEWLRDDVTGTEMTSPQHIDAMLPAGFNSEFAIDFATTYIMIPMHKQLVINPVDPREYVSNGSFVTTTSTNPWIPQLRISVSILNTTQGPDGAYVPSGIIESEENYDFYLDTVKSSDYVPGSIIWELISGLRRRQIPTHREDRFDGADYFIDGDLPAEVLDRLPIIEYRIHTDSGAASIIQLNGHDYIGPLVDNRRKLFIREGYRNYIGLNTLSKIALFVDNENRIIGFGEPL